MIEFGFVPLHEVVREIAPNVGRYYTEMTEGDEYGFPDIDWDTYLEASYAGGCYVVTVRDKEKLVGYSVFTIGRNLRYKDMIEASNSGLFLEKPYRGRHSRSLIQKSDEYLKNMGVHETSYTLSDDRIGRMLSGYQSNYKIWSKKYHG